MTAAFCRRLLNWRLGHAPTIHVLGLVVIQIGNIAAAKKLITKAFEIEAEILANMVIARSPPLRAPILHPQAWVPPPINECANQSLTDASRSLW